MAGIFGWTVLHLLRNPDVLSAFEAEIAANPRNEDGTYQIKSMPLSDACIKETGRLYGHAISLRYAPRDLIGPDGTVIPKGFVSASPLAVHQDPDLYPQPGKWNPGRFMPSADGTPSNYAKLLKNSEFHMFGSGRHMCPGEKMARTILRGSLWPAVLDNYRLEVKEGLVPGEGVDGVGVKPDHGKTLGVPYGVRPVVVKLVKRKMPLSAVIVG
jgi:sterol 14-demethylase